MPAWFLPALKAVLPYVSPIISSALPVFTTRKNPQAAAQGDLVQQQIGELQDAASHNAEHIRELAETLQKTVTALEQAAADVEKRIRRMMAICLAAILLALAAAVLAALALVAA
jgi:hypothetical protein